jgi:hypothetical protein
MGLTGNEGSPAGDRLFNHDLKIASNSLRATFAHWRDRLSAVALLVAVPLLLRSWLAEQPWTIAAAAVLGAGLIVGALVGRTIAARLAFHGFDGAFAADALRARTRCRYIVAWHAARLAAWIAASLIVRPAVFVPALAGYPGGALAGHLSAGLAWRFPAGPRSIARLRSWARSPWAGLAGALALLLSMAAARSLAEQDVAVIAGLATALIALALTGLDQAIIRFMALTGRGPLAIVWHHARGTLLFIGIAVPACLIGIGPMAGAAVLAISAAALLLMTMRILTYQVSEKRVADMLVCVLVAILAATAFYAPVLLPVVIVAVLWRFGRRAARMTWLLA